jgi:hypothetical protein
MAKIPGEGGGRRKIGTDKGTPTAGTKGGTRGRPNANNSHTNSNDLSSGSARQGQGRQASGREGRGRIAGYVADLITGKHRKG